MDLDQQQQQMNDLTSEELGYVARFIFMTHPGVMAEALDALAAYRRDHPEKAALFLGKPREAGA